MVYYKTNFKERVDYLKISINSSLNDLLEKEELSLNEDRKYVKKRWYNEKWFTSYNTWFFDI